MVRTRSEVKKTTIILQRINPQNVNVAIPPHDFSVLCKTTEFHARLNLPVNSVDIMGTRSRLINLSSYKMGKKVSGSCWYKYHQIEKTRTGFGRLLHGWADFVEEMELNQGDVLYFKGTDDPMLFNVVCVGRNNNIMKIEEDDGSNIYF